MGKRRTAEPIGEDWVSSVPELARRTGFNERTIRGWKTHPAWPFPDRGPYYLPGLLRWHEGVIGRTEREDGAVTKADLDKEKLAVDIAIKEIRRRELEGLLVDRGLLDRFCEALVSWTRDRIEQWVATIPSHFADSAGVRTVLENLYDRFCADMQDQAAHLRFNTETNRIEGGTKGKAASKVKAARRRHRKVRRSG